MTNINIFDIFLRSSIFVKFIILLLIYFSVISWAIMIQRIRILNAVNRELKVFENKFWSNVELSHLYRASKEHHNNLSGTEHIFYSGFKEFIRLYRVNKCGPEAIIAGVSRAMYISMNRELEMLLTYIEFLGIISSISPYIGLFGTILGIINAFIELGAVKQVTLPMIAPNIAEALIATAIGLFSAIPAVIGYNYLNQRINKLELHYDNFMEEFTAILYRQVFVSIRNNKE